MPTISQDIARDTLRTAIHDDAVDIVTLAAVGLPLFKPAATPSQQALSSSPIVITRDADGNTLVAGARYLLDGHPVRVLREERRGSHIMDAFMAVFYLDASLEERMLCVDPDGDRIGAPFISRFNPAPASSS